ncbi:peptide deformylase [Actinomarinicola tropica]|uniref:Peptide deformylase n=2 Tax=Actinomarinicola tropica TaxID=2789776 RepID=A0A5Q2RMC4_9ACTN|nr:peptide deformylase [Actinomarinicola tropica]
MLPAPVLSTRAEEVTAFGAESRALADDLLDTMRASAHSVGIAAPQIGVGLRAFALDVTGHKKADSCHGEVVLFNPEVVLATGRDVGREGCMSVPDLTGDVARRTHVVVRGLDPDGVERVLECNAFEARAVQHEIDHLDGHLFLDRVVAADRVFPRRVYR